MTSENPSDGARERSPSDAAKSDQKSNNSSSAYGSTTGPGNMTKAKTPTTSTAPIPESSLLPFYLIIASIAVLGVNFIRSHLNTLSEQEHDWDKSVVPKGMRSDEVYSLNLNDIVLCI